jgi:hypothetical protein
VEEWIESWVRFEGRLSTGKLRQREKRWTGRNLSGMSIDWQIGTRSRDRQPFEGQAAHGKLCDMSVYIAACSGTEY